MMKHGSLHDIQLDDVADFETTDKAMTMMGMSDAEKMAIYTVVAGVLHLGNVEFEEEQEGTKGGGGGHWGAKVWDSFLFYTVMVNPLQL